MCCMVFVHRNHPAIVESWTIFNNWNIEVSPLCIWNFFPIWWYDVPALLSAFIRLQVFHSYHGAGAAQLRGSSLLRRAEATETETKPVKRGPSEATCIGRFAHLGGLGVILNKMVMVLQRRLAKTYTSKNMVTSVEVTLWSSGLQLTVKLFEHLKKFKIFEFVFVILASPGRKPSRHAAFSCPWIQSLGVDGEEIWRRKWSKKHTDIDRLIRTWSNKKVTQVLVCCIFGCFFVFACV